MTIAQTVVAIAALAGITVLGITDSVGSDALVAIYSAVIGAGLGAAGNAAAVATASRLNGEEPPS